MNLSQLKQPHQKGPQCLFSHPTKLYLSGVEPLSSMSFYNSTARGYIIIFQKKNNYGLSQPGSKVISCKNHLGPKSW